jgi:hypothetical protein
MPFELHRRNAIKSSLAALASSAATTSIFAAESRSFRLIEKAGLRRFGYPVHLLLPDIGPTDQIRLLKDGKPVTAQFRSTKDAAGKPAIALDFSTSPGPLETETYTLETGVKGPEPKEGIRVEKHDGFYRVSSGKDLHYEVPTNLTTLARSIVNGKQEYVDSKSSGFSLIDKGGQSIAIGGSSVTSEIDYQGPITASLRYQAATKIGESVVSSEIHLLYPRSKSWVEIVWTINDPSKTAPAVQFDLDLLIEGTPTLIDLGASETVYGTIKDDQVMSLAAAPKTLWKVYQSQAKGPGLSLFAGSTPNGNNHAAGWAHVMDRKRCTAAAFDQFGQHHNDAIVTKANGNLSLKREFSDLNETRRTFHFWLHFVPMPVQIGALTSPQAMQNPLVVEWVR